MLSLKYIRENIPSIIKAIESKNIDFDLDHLIKLDLKRRNLIQDVEKLKSKRNIINKTYIKKNSKSLSTTIQGYSTILSKFLIILRKPKN